MRVTPGMMMSSMLHNIEQNQVRTEQLQNQITSGSRITRPSDDPIGAARALNLRESLDQSDQYVRNIDQATSWLNSTDSVLDAVTQAVNRARELAVQGASETLSPNDRASIAAEISQLQQHVLDLAGSKYGPYYMFAGTDSDAPGFVLAQSTNTNPAAYQGNDEVVMRTVAQGTSINVNTDARATFNPVFEALETLRTGLVGNNTTQVQTSLMSFDSALDSVNTSRAQIGAKVNRLDFLRNRQLDIGVNLTALLSEVKDVDMAEAITSFSMAQNVYNASLKAGAQGLQPSLLDYLR